MTGGHRCPVCEATFTRPQHVARHMRSHTGDRPYECTDCFEQYTRSDLLARHTKRCHISPTEKILAKIKGRRKASATRALTSKQACDECVQNKLSCDGSIPCPTCVQRSVPCTFIKFYRQTAPSGPGHNPHLPRHIPSNAPRSYFPQPVAIPFPSQQNFSFQPAPQPYLTNLADHQSNYRDLMHNQTQQQPSPVLYDRTSSWMKRDEPEPTYNGVNGGGAGVARARSVEHHHNHYSHSNQVYAGMRGWGRRDSLESGGSSAASGSSGASSSVHLPLYENVDPSPAADPRLEAFGMMTFEERNALYDGAAPFFGDIFPSSSAQQSTTSANSHASVPGMMQIPTPREAETRELREFLKEYMSSTPLSHPANHHTHSTSPPAYPAVGPPNGRKRVSSMPSVNTPTGSIVGGGGGEGKGSFEDAVMARKTLGDLSMGGIQGIKGRRMTHVNPPSSSSSSSSPYLHGHPSLNHRPAYGVSLAGAMGDEEIPNWKRPPAQDADLHGRSKRLKGDDEADDSNVDRMGCE